VSRVLIVDDEESIRRSLAGILSDEGFEVETASDGEKALVQLGAGGPPDLVLLDIAMPGRDGILILEELRRIRPELPVVMMTGHGTIETAVRATKLGAFDFIEKPLSVDKLLLTIQHALERMRLERENQRLLADSLRAHEILGASAPIRKLEEQIRLAAPTNGWVLITGENGTGKELVARQIHFRSLRQAKPFVDVNCAAIPEELIESELFGHEKGAFTGAIARKRGKFEQANGGTLFLDEIADMSLKTPAKILRILQEHAFERVGGTETIEVDVRVIAATNKDLEKEIAAGRFRDDLYYRLNVIPFHVPALRERREDIPVLARAFVEEFCAEAGTRRTPGPDDPCGDGHGRGHSRDAPRTCAARGRGARHAGGGATRLRAGVPHHQASRARLEHLTDGRRGGARAGEPVAQDPGARHRGGAWLRARRCAPMRRSLRTPPRGGRTAASPWRWGLAGRGPHRDSS
jgi:two-component system nitrogen regulation response regulator NtrX